MIAKSMRSDVRTRFRALVARAFEKADQAHAAHLAAGDVLRGRALEG